MTAPQAWRIYHHDAMNKTELTSSPSRVKKAREAGLTVVELVEVTWKDGVLHARMPGVIHQLTVIAKLEP